MRRDRFRRPGFSLENLTDVVEAKARGARAQLAAVAIAEIAEKIGFDGGAGEKFPVDAGAVEAAERALAALPPAEALLRARTAAVAADASRRRWDTASELAYLEDALRSDASVIRRLGLRIPVRVEVVAEGEAAAVAGRMLARSPRHRADGDAFVLVVDGGPDRLQTCLRSPSGAQIQCAPRPRPAPAVNPETGEVGPPLTEWEYGQMVAWTWHDAAFGLPVGASRLDLRSLDGSTIADNERARERMNALLQGLSEPGP